MTSAKRNLSTRPVGKGRGVPIRLAERIARKYGLTRIVIWTLDRQWRQRIVLWGSNDTEAVVGAHLAQQIAAACGWSKEAGEIQVTSVKRRDERIKELEAALAQIADQQGDPVEIARAAGKFPSESDGAILGAWLYFPKGRLTLAENLQRTKTPDDKILIARRHP